MNKAFFIRVLAVILAVFTALTLSACTTPEVRLVDHTLLDSSSLTQLQQPAGSSSSQPTDSEEAAEEQSANPDAEEAETQPEQPLTELTIIRDFRSSFVHGEKGAAYQKYIVLHDTESWADPASIISWWDGNGNLIAAHFIIGTDGTVYQCVPLDKIAHHAGYGNAGHNAYYGIVEDGRDDMRGTTWVGDWAPDYGMNAWSIGIELVHVGGAGYYPQAQLDALDLLIAYIDDYFGFESTIIDHKAWRSGNSDTSPEFADYLWSYQTYRRHAP